MRDHLGKFTAMGATVVAVANDDAQDVATYWKENEIPFYCVPDPEAKLGKRYSQQSRLGLMPALFVIDRHMVIRFAHYGKSMDDIPTTDALLTAVQQWQ